MRMFVFNFGLCLIGCVLAALLGRLTRKTGGFRLLVGLLVAPMLSWVALESGILPTVLLLFIMILEPVPDNWHIFNNDGGIGEDFFFLALLMCSFILTFVSFCVFARNPKPKPRR